MVANPGGAELQCTVLRQGDHGTILSEAIVMAQPQGEQPSTHSTEVRIRTGSAGVSAGTLP